MKAPIPMYVIIPASECNPTALNIEYMENTMRDKTTTQTITVSTPQQVSFKPIVNWCMFIIFIPLLYKYEKKRIKVSLITLYYIDYFNSRQNVRIPSEYCQKI